MRGFPELQASRHFWFRQIVAPGTAATDVSFVQLDIVRPRNLHPLSGRHGNALSMCQMAGVVEGRQPIQRLWQAPPLLP